MECPICLESIPASACATTSCRHVFHRTCLQSWKTTHGSCPVCRHDISHDHETSPFDGWLMGGLAVSHVEHLFNTFNFDDRAAITPTLRDKFVARCTLIAKALQNPGEDIAHTIDSILRPEIEDFQMMRYMLRLREQQVERLQADMAQLQQRQRPVRFTISPDSAPPPAVRQPGFIEKLKAKFSNHKVSPIFH